MFMNTTWTTWTKEKIDLLPKDMEETTYIEPEKAEGNKWEGKVHKVASWYDSESEEVLIAQCSEYCHEGWKEVDSLIEPIHQKCKKCFSEAYER